jgi:hypothetical protein
LASKRCIGVASFRKFDIENKLGELNAVAIVKEIRWTGLPR